MLCVKTGSDVDFAGSEMEYTFPPLIYDMTPFITSVWLKKLPLFDLFKELFLRSDRKIAINVILG
jgi:hypothetical protein